MATRSPTRWTLALRPRPPAPAACVLGRVRPRAIKRRGPRDPNSIRRLGFFPDNMRPSSQGHERSSHLLLLLEKAGSWASSPLQATCASYSACGPSFSLPGKDVTSAMGPSNPILVGRPTGHWPGQRSVQGPRRAVGYPPEQNQSRLLRPSQEATPGCLEEEDQPRVS